MFELGKKAKRMIKPLSEPFKNAISLSFSCRIICHLNGYLKSFVVQLIVESFEIE